MVRQIEDCHHTTQRVMSMPDKKHVAVFYKPFKLGIVYNHHQSHLERQDKNEDIRTNKNNGK